MPIEPNGIAHIVLNVSNWKTSLAFYQKLAALLNLQEVWCGKESAYFIGGKTAIMIRLAGEGHRKDKFHPKGIGLNHVCFRARSREDVETFSREIGKLGVRIVQGPKEGPWAPGYYFVTFEDPDGIRIEVNFVPGKGVLSDKIEFNPAGDFL